MSESIFDSLTDDFIIRAIRKDTQDKKSPCGHGQAKEMEYVEGSLKKEKQTDENKMRASCLFKCTICCKDFKITKQFFEIPDEMMK